MRPMNHELCWLSLLDEDHRKAAVVRNEIVQIPLYG